MCSYAPSGFSYSYIVSIPSQKNVTVKPLPSIISEASPPVQLNQKFLDTALLINVNPFSLHLTASLGLRKDVHVASPCVQCTSRLVIDNMNQRWEYTANIYAIDISKTFNRVNHHGLVIKLINRLIPNELLLLLESCVKRANVWSCEFSIESGVRQGSVSSPFLFSIHVYDLAKSYSSFIRSFIVLYADDILLLAPTVSQLQKLLTNCDSVLDQLDMAINSKKSCCLRIGQRHNNPCAPSCTLSGELISWVDELQYLGVIIMCVTMFSLHHAKKLFYRSGNAIFGEMGRIVSEEVVLQLIISKCISVIPRR